MINKHYEKINYRFHGKTYQAEIIGEVLNRFQLRVTSSFSVGDVIEIIEHDKYSNNDTIYYAEVLSQEGCQVWVWVV